MNTNEDNKNMIECDKELTKHISHIKLMLELFWSRCKKDYLLSLRVRVTHYKRGHSQYPNIRDIVIDYEGKKPRQSRRMGKTVELIESKGKSIRSAKVLIGKTQNEVENKVEINEPTKA